MNPPGAFGPSPARPSTVSVAFVMQLVLVGVLLLISVVSIAQAVHYDGLIDAALTAVPGDTESAASERSSNVVGTVLTAGATTLLAAWLGVTALWVRRGSNVARVLTLIGVGTPLVLGLLACVGGTLLAVLLVGLLTSEGLSDEENLSDEESLSDDEGLAELDGSAFYDRLEQLDSGGWSTAYDAVGMLAAGVVLLLAVTLGILLLTRPSNRFFRPPGSGWAHQPSPYYGPPPGWAYQPAQYYGPPPPPGWTSQPGPYYGPPPPPPPGPDVTKR